MTSVPTVTPPSEPPGELETTVIEHGPSDGHEADEGDVVSIRYVGVLQDGGTQFDSNYSAASPTNVTVGASSNIAGWNEGLLGVRKGDQIQLDIPADLAYGSAGSQQPPVPPDTPVSYIIEVEDVLDVPDITLPDGRVDEITKTVVTEGNGDACRPAVRHRQRVLHRRAQRRRHPDRQQLRNRLAGAARARPGLVPARLRRAARGPASR